jgi:hypothetical protein
VWAWWPADFARMAMLPFLPLGSTGTVTHALLAHPWLIDLAMDRDRVPPFRTWNRNRNVGSIPWPARP